MSGKSLFCLTAFIGSVLGLSAAAVTTSKNIDIVITHGAALTTSTYVNTSGATVPAGTPLLMGQAFRRGDVFLSSNCAIPRNAVTHNPLIWQHDNTATRLENGDDGSVRHWSFGVLTDAAVPAGGKYSIEWVSTDAACPLQTAHQSLAALATAHDLKLHFTNVVNQDLTMRGAGSLTFDINAAAANTGRDAPTKYATGGVYDGWRIVGPPTWDTASSGRLIGAMLSPAQTTLSSWTGITNGSFHVSLDGAAYDVTGINLSSATSMNAVALAINARLAAAGIAATMSFDPNDQVQRFQLFSNSTGTSSSVSFLTAAATGTDISAQLLMTAGATSYNSQVNSYTQTGLAAGSKDPLLYVVCYVDVTTQSSGVTMGKVRPTCGVHNGWMNVAAGSTGNTGNPGPAGYANDPQMVIYRPALLDGTHALIDWGAMFDGTGTVYPSQCERGGVTSCWQIANSAGDTPWIVGSTYVYSTTGTPPTCTVFAASYIPAGSCTYVPGHYYGAMPSGTAGGMGLDPTYISFLDRLTGSDVAPVGLQSGAFMAPTSPGTGTQSFSYRLSHPKWQSWYTFTPEGFAPWSDGTTMSVSPFDIALDQGSFSGERRYWEETGVVPPIRLTGQSPNVPPGGLAVYGNEFYMPMARGILIGGGGAGERPELDILNEYAGACWYTMTTSDCLHMRTLSFSQYPFETLLNEATGYLPSLINGPPLGPGGSGNSGSYPTIGGPYPETTLDRLAEAVCGASSYANLTAELEGTPINLGWGNSATPNSTQYLYGAGFWGCGAAQEADHEPEFAGLSYRLYGNPQFLEMIYHKAERANQSANKFYTNPGTGIAYYGDTVGQNQTRGGHWRFRDLTLGAAFGDDTRPERTYFDDSLTTAYNSYLSRLSSINGSATNAMQSSIVPPGFVSWGETFMDAYGASTGAQVWAMLRAPLGKLYSDKFSVLLNDICGHSAADFPAFLSARNCTLYSRAYAIKDGSVTLQQSLTGIGNPNTGFALNTTDASDYGDTSSYYTFTGGSGQVRMNSPTIGQLTVGDEVKNFSGVDGSKIDQLDPTRKYKVTGPIDNTNFTFYIQCQAADHIAYPAQCPTAGAAFTGFTATGSSLSTSQGNLIYRAQYDDGGTVDGNYVPYNWQSISALNAIGYDLGASITQFNMRFGTITKDGGPSYVLDPTVVVP